MSQDDAEKPNTSPPAEETASSTPPAEEAPEKATEEEAAEPAAEAAGGSEEAAAEPEAPKEPSLEEQLADSKKATAAMKEKMLRVAADFENFRRRSSREVEDARERGTQTAVKDLLPVFDNLERATAHVDESTDAQSMVKGLEMVHKQFLDVLGKMGIERVAAVGEGFDPNVHESIQYEHSDEHDAGVVMTELQPGYRMGKMLLRPALVVVSRGPAPKEEEAATGAEGEEKEPQGEASADADEQPSGDSSKDDAADDAKG